MKVQVIAATLITLGLAGCSPIMNDVIVFKDGNGKAFQMLPYVEYGTYYVDRTQFVDGSDDLSGAYTSEWLAFSIGGLSQLEFRRASFNIGTVFLHFEDRANPGLHFTLKWSIGSDFDDVTDGSVRVLPALVRDRIAEMQVCQILGGEEHCARFIPPNGPVTFEYVGF